jgi:hypothetical protein
VDAVIVDADRTVRMGYGVMTDDVEMKRPEA